MVTASIVTYQHHLLDIEPVLQSLLAAPVEVIYVIDHSADIMPNLANEISEYMRVMGIEEGKILHIPHENNGYGGGHNVGIRKALELGSTYHLVANPDIWFGKSVIPALIQYMDDNPDVGQIMPKILFPDGEVQRLAKLLPTPLDIFGRFCLPPKLIEKRNERYELHASDFKRIMNAPYLSGCFMFFRMEALQKVNLFDEHLFMYAEDIDITRRIHALYKTLYFPSECVYHKFSRASHRSLKLFYIHVTNIIMYFNKWGWWNDKERTLFNQQLLKELNIQ